MAAGSRWPETGLVFVSCVGTALEPRNLFRSFKSTLRKAGLPDIRFHDLRHSAASLMLAQGVPLGVVMEVLGHSPIASQQTLTATLADSRLAAEQEQRAMTGSHIIQTYAQLGELAFTTCDRPHQAENLLDRITFAGRSRSAGTNSQMGYSRG